MPLTHTQKTPAPTRESVWFVVVWCLPYGFTNSNNESGIRYLARNLQGDIIESGSSTSFGASHKYDAWGAVTETVLGSSTNAANFQYGYIFGYRGYQYDKETGLYYCQSRYYNSRIGRFLSADEPTMAAMGLFSGEVLDNNLFAYCANNSIMNVDHTGYYYNRNWALNYASKWWKSTNSRYKPYGNDCANFVSQCLDAGKWGKVPVKNSYFENRHRFPEWRYDAIWVFGWRKIKITKEWGTAPGLYNLFKKYPSSYSKHIKIKNSADLKNNLKNVEGGDVIFFEGNSGIYHAAMVGKVNSTDIFYFAHTSSRNGYDTNYKSQYCGAISKQIAYHKVIHIIKPK